MNRVNWRMVVEIAIFIAVGGSVFCSLLSSCAVEKCPTDRTIEIARAWDAEEGGVKTVHTVYYVADTTGQIYRFEDPVIYGQLREGRPYGVTVDECLARYNPQGVVPIVAVQP